MGEPSVGAPLSAGPTEDRLDSWKEIAVYLNRDATTVQRWEKREGMPVHRHLHDKIGSVYASKAELDAWARSRNLQAAQKNGNDVAIEEPVASAPATETTPSFWNRRRVVGVALVAFLMIGGFAAWRLLFARPVLTTTDVILQTSFINRTGDPIFDNSLDNALAVKLTESPFLSLLPEADVRRTMGTMRHNPNERVTRELGIEICRRQGLKAVVVPAIDAFGGRYLITLEAIDASSGKTLARRQVEAESKDKVIAALGDRKSTV